jgi:GT2 family glycosyltransferase
LDILRPSLKVEVIVVDNASSDNSVAMLKKDFKWVKVIESPQNRGFAAGNNLGLVKISSKYSMLLNSDTQFTANTFLEKMIQYMDQHPEVAVITPRLLLADGTLDPASHRGEPTLWASFTYFAKLEKLFPQSPIFGQYHQLYKNLQTVHPIDACSGAAMIVRTSAMKEVGLLDEQFFMYAEDLDWCKRFREAGYQIIYFPESVIIHHKYKSGRKSSDVQLSRKTNHHFYQTMLQYYDKHYQHKYPFFVRTLVHHLLKYKKGEL